MDIREATEGERLLYNRIVMLEAEYNKERERADAAQKALRKIDDQIPERNHYRGCMCSICAWYAELKAIARKGLGD